MKKTVARVLQINDIVQWNDKSEIELSPNYQRNRVWNDKAKSYLMDTIIRGLPIPPIFLRQIIDVKTKSTKREIIDGQQRIKTILEYIVTESFAISKSHNEEFGNKKFSELDEDLQESILEYEILSNIVNEKDDTLIYDMFARLNSNNYVLNKQELRNSKYWGEFKVLAYKETSKYRSFFKEYGLMSSNDFARMRDTELINSMIIFLLDGIITETPKIIDKTYESYDKEFNDSEEISKKIANIMEIIKYIYKYFDGNLSIFKNKNYFFTFYCVIGHQMYNVEENMNCNEMYSEKYIKDNLEKIYDRFGQFINEYTETVIEKNTNNDLYYEYDEFAKLHKSRTTNKKERIKRIQFLNERLVVD